MSVNKGDAQESGGTRVVRNKRVPGAFACKTAAYAYEPFVVARVTHVIAGAIQPKDAASWGR